MKIRTDFVTNSSSSSFILSFKTKEELEEFKEYASDMYSEFYSLFDSIFSSKESHNKDEMIQLIKRYYEIETGIRDQIIEKYYPEKEHMNDKDYYKNRANIELSDEYKKDLEELLKNTDFDEKKKEIEQSYDAVHSMIWDTNGGELEWAIRNGFLENEFGKYCKLCWNVG